METPHNPQEFDTVRFTDYLRFIRERWWVVVVLTLVLVGASVYLTSKKTPQYQTSSEVIHQAGGWEETLLGLSSFYYYAQRIPVDARLLETVDMAERVKTLTGSTRTPEQLLGMIRVEPVSEVETIVVHAVSPDAQEAATVANGFAEAFVTMRKEDMDASLNEASAMLQQQLQAIPYAELEGAEASSINNRLRQLETLSDLSSSDYQLLRAASVPALPFTPQPVRDGLLALAIGLIGGIALAFLLEYLDKRIKDEQGIERAFRLPALVTMPYMGKKGPFRRAWKPGAKGPPPGIGFLKGQSSLVEPYMLLRSNLRYFGVDQPLKVVMITSALPTQGKTTVSINLGLAMALAGDRVLLIEADMRRPRLYQYLSLANEVGLSSVLAGTAHLREAIQKISVSDFVSQSRGKSAGRDTTGKTLEVLSAGPVPPNPGELVASKRMGSLIKQAAEEGGYDYVLIDTAPALLVADPLVLAPHSDGVLLTARLRQSKRDEATRVRELLDRAGARVLGVVVGGHRKRRGYYGYGYGYGSYGYGRKGGYGDSPGVEPAPGTPRAAGPQTAAPHLEPKAPEEAVLAD